jgi:hypothetical protein
MPAIQLMVRQVHIVGLGLPGYNHARGEIAILVRPGEKSSLTISMVAEEGSPLPTFWSNRWQWESLTVSVARADRTLTFTLTGRSVDGAMTEIRVRNDLRPLMFIVDGLVNSIPMMAITS